jgi:hypothetical protein
VKYLCLAYGNETIMKAKSAKEMEEIGRLCKPYDDDLNGSGHVVFHEGLNWGTTVIRPKKGRPAVTDGPFLETKEVVGGAFVIEASNHDEAVEIASKHPAAHLGEEWGWAIEVFQCF